MRVRSNKKGVQGEERNTSDTEAPSPSSPGHNEAPDAGPAPAQSADVGPCRPVNRKPTIQPLSRGRLRRFLRLRRPRKWRSCWNARLIVATMQGGGLVRAFEILNIESARGLELLESQPELLARLEDVLSPIASGAAVLPETVEYDPQPTEMGIQTDDPARHDLRKRTDRREGVL